MFVWDELSVSSLSPKVNTFYNKVLNEAQRQRLCENIAGHLKDAQLFIQKKAVSDLCLTADTLGNRGFPLGDGQKRGWDEGS